MEMYRHTQSDTIEAVEVTGCSEHFAYVGDTRVHLSFLFETFEEALDALIQRLRTQHDSLRMSLDYVDGQLERLEALEVA